MGVQQAVATIRDAAFLEYGCMGHMNYAGKDYKERITDGCKVYSTHLSETDIALGDLKRLYEAAETVITNDHPKALLLTPSSVPEMTGTDLGAVAMELSPLYPHTKIVSFESGGFGATVCRGIELALDTLARTLPVDCGKTADFTYNIIGSCYDLYNYRADAEEIVRMMWASFGAKPLCILTSDTDVDQIERMGGANLNLVIRKEGIKAATRLQDRFGTPMVCGRPYGTLQTRKWIGDIEETAGRESDRASIRRACTEVSGILETARRGAEGVPELFLGGNADIVGGIASFAEQELGLKIGAKWSDDPASVTADIPFFDEAKRMEALKAEQYLLLANAELITYSGKDGVVIAGTELAGKGLNIYAQPYVGLRGAANLAERLIGNAAPQGRGGGKPGGGGRPSGGSRPDGGGRSGGRSGSGARH